eukprot:scaffold194_cov119-Isochrysis_galbana.AAC.3
MIRHYRGGFGVRCRRGQEIGPGRGESLRGFDRWKGRRATVNRGVIGVNREPPSAGRWRGRRASGEGAAGREWGV